MKKLILFLTTLLTLATLSTSFAAYRVTVTRTGQDMYKSGSNLIVTLNCYQHVYSSPAVLEWIHPLGAEVPYGGKLTFEDGEMCWVKVVY